MRLSTRLLRRRRPLFGQAVVWCLLASAFTIALWPFETMPHERHGSATIFSILPESWLSLPALWICLRGALLIGATLWSLHLFVPWSCWLTSGTFIALWSLHLETVSTGAHIVNISAMLLVIHAFWFHCYQNEIAAARREKRYFRTPLYPRWAFWLSLFYIGLYHSLAGISKLRYSGLDWANGTSLQLWVHLWGLPYSVSRAIILSHRLVAQLFQGAALFFETASLPSIFFPRFRLVVGLAMVGFYISVIETFNYGFHFNLVFTALFFLPGERCAELVYAWWRTRRKKHLTDST